MLLETIIGQVHQQPMESSGETRALSGSLQPSISNGIPSGMKLSFHATAAFITLFREEIPNGHNPQFDPATDGPYLVSHSQVVKPYLHGILTAGVHYGTAPDFFMRS